MRNKIINKEFAFKIILPTLLVFSIFTALIFAVIIPSIKNYMIDGKREMIKELTNSAWSVLDEFENEVSDSILTLGSAQKQAVQRIENMRYGDERKDYFWITDLHPNMIMHPYRKDLNNTDLSDYKDPSGKRLFVEFVNAVKANGEDYVDYMWQWKDDSTKIVPKLSFVKKFDKWGWVVGTGIYIEDVNEEISALTNHLFYISFGILCLLGFILSFISKQSLSFERKRLEAENSLIESEAKYRALVEASTDGLIMMLDRSIIYSNQAMLKMLGYDEKNISVLELNNILVNNNTELTSGSQYFKDIVSGMTPLEQYTAQLKRENGTIIDVIFYSSNIALGDKVGYTIIVKDVSTHKKVEEELDLNKEKFLTLTNSINIGVFRSTWASNGKIIEVNKTAANILGYINNEEVYSIKLLDLFHNRFERNDFTKFLLETGVVTDSIIRIKTKDGSTAIVSISAVLVMDSKNEPKYFDGTIEDITNKIKLAEERENLIVELQTSLRFLNQPIGHFLKHFVTCNMNLSINRVAKLMTKEKYSAALIKADSNEFIGIITDHDIRRRVVAENLSLERPIFEVMSSPIITISSTSLVFEAFVMMNENSTRHLAVKNQYNEIVGIISSEELVTVQRNSTSYLLREIERSESVDELILAHDKLPRLVKVLIDSGARSQIVTHIITSIFEAITNKLISFAIDELGKPPVEFTFIALGSVGREEQTLNSDQDNAIIYEDVPIELEESVHKYFHQFGIKICDWLNDCGYVFCPGEAMAKNPKWCQPISKWKKYFHTWITNSDQQDLINLSIFFDFRSIYGSTKLTDELQKYLFNTAYGQSGFFQHLVKNSLVHKPPVGLLGNIILESKGEHSETFDIKLAIMPICDFARIYALKNYVNNPNSIERLNGLLNKGIINKTTFEELKESYNYLMQLRLKHQVKQIMDNVSADNYVNPNNLTQIEQKTLKNIFTQILSIQKKLNYDFSGEAI
ncbi:MAG: cache domain-containing protein [Bacteroidetes bacterium]|nr:cache domain-containing protein [Bacteroidota bacterium]MBU1797762.1 cache domain-containing protein [Bacteroidota bacterium]